MEPIAHIRTDFPEKFGIPRQSGLVDGLEGRIVFEPKFRHPDAVRGLEQFSCSATRFLRNSDRIIEKK